MMGCRDAQAFARQTFIVAKTHFLRGRTKGVVRTKKTRMKFENAAVSRRRPDFSSLDESFHWNIRSCAWVRRYAGCVPHQRARFWTDGMKCLHQQRTDPYAAAQYRCA